MEERGCSLGERGLVLIWAEYRVKVPSSGVTWPYLVQLPPLAGPLDSSFCDSFAWLLEAWPCTPGAQPGSVPSFQGWA